MYPTLWAAVNDRERQLPVTRLTVERIIATTTMDRDWQYLNQYVQFTTGDPISDDDDIGPRLGAFFRYFSCDFSAHFILKDLHVRRVCTYIRRL